MLTLLLQFVPFFALVLLGWGAARSRLLALDGIGALNTFVLFFGLPAMLYRLGASGALIQDGLLGLVLAYGAAGVLVTMLALYGGVRAGLCRRDSGLMALATAFPNTGFLGLPLLTGLLGPQAAGPVAATLLIDVLLLSSVCLAWAHSHAARAAVGDDPQEAWHAAQASLKGALRNPLLWSMGLGLAAYSLGVSLPHAVDETLRLLGLSATPAALFTLGGHPGACADGRAGVGRVIGRPAGCVADLRTRAAQVAGASGIGTVCGLGFAARGRAIECAGLADGDHGGCFAISQQRVHAG
jgi:malonate transporter